MAIEVPARLVIYPVTITTVTQGLLWADPAPPVQQPDPSPRMQLHSPLHRSQGYSSSSQQHKALVDGPLPDITAIPPKHSNKTGGICPWAKPAQLTVPPDAPHHLQMNLGISEQLSSAEPRYSYKEAWESGGRINI